MIAWRLDTALRPSCETATARGMSRRVTILFSDARGTFYRRESQQVIEVLSEGDRATGVVTVDDRGRQTTYDLGTCLPVEGGDGVLARSSQAAVSRDFALERRQLSLPLA